ncbi:MAG: phosphate regulon sensor histidine kinase PhoR [Oleiphilaceae bacterium]|nr:phosphate regulon sensor histidine kinase PhoR [Oleiphilaceae bacterium]
MHKQAGGHLRYLIWGVALTILFGLAIGQLAWVLVIALSAYLLWSLRQAIRLHRWLYGEETHDDIPESYGLWGDLFEGLYSVQQQNLATQNSLKSMIERVRSSTNALRDGVIMTNGEGQMDWWNEAAAELFGFRRDKDFGQLITNLVREPTFKKYFERKDYEQALELVSPANPNLILRIHITLFGEEDRLILAQDITRMHHLEQMRRDFVSNVSHEMRTPLTVIHGYIETLQDAADLPTKWQRPLKSMADQTRRLEVLVSDLLLLEKYESEDRAQSQKDVSVSKLLEMICSDARLLSGEREHKIRLHCEAHGSLVGEENQLRSAFSNLVFNAVKYTPEKGQIDVLCWQDNRGLHVSVRDTGCGFDPIHIPRLTERFYRADPSRNNQTGGSGLGLAIVKHVLINHDATLEIKSQIDRGSEFTCHFPPHRVNAALDTAASA